MELTLTSHVRSLVADEGDGEEAAPTLALLSVDEPGLFGLATFQGPDDPSPPVLRLIVTQSGEVTLP